MGHRIGLIGDNSVEFIMQLINIWNQGNCAVIIDWRIPLETAIKMLLEAGANECYIDHDVVINDSIRNKINIQEYKSTRSIIYVPQEVKSSFMPNYSSKEALILFSSGTTGKAKGVILSHYAINTNADAIIQYMELKQDDCIYLIKTFAHSATLVGELLVGLKSGIKMIVSPTIMSAGINLTKIAEYNATIVCMNPTLLKIYTTAQKKKKENINSIRAIYFSGSTIENSVLEEACISFNKAKILNVYGLSEAGPRVSAQTLSSTTNKPGGVGKAIKGVEIKILNEKGNETEAFEKGRICVATKCLAKGYVNPNIKLCMLDKKWLETGDIGYFDNEGELYISGRKDNMIIVSSHNVYPEEIENYIRSIDGVNDCVVLPKKDETYGQKIICYYVSENDMNINLINHCRMNLAPYEIPSEFVQVNRLLTNLNGKKCRDFSTYNQERINMQK